MRQMDDWQLLSDYASRDSEEAFRTLVDRYAGLVYHGALRQAGNPHTAQDVTQAVFIALARKAGKIPRGTILSGWLFRATRFAFTNLAREAVRRQRREQEAITMETILQTDETESVWEQIAPHLDDALDKLSLADRQALLVRFFEGKSHKEVALAQGTIEDAAKARISRALGKLRLIFARRGFVVPSVALFAALTAHGTQAVPVGVAASIATLAITKGTAATTSAFTTVEGILKPGRPAPHEYVAPVGCPRGRRRIHGRTAPVEGPVEGTDPGRRRDGAGGGPWRIHSNVLGRKRVRIERHATF